MPPALELQDFLENALWRDRFDDEHLAVGQKLKSKVRELAGERPDEETFTLRAEIAGESSEVTLWPNGGGWDLETSCSCEFGRFCPHAAALLAEASKPRTLARVLEGTVVRSRQALALATAAALEPAPEDIPHVSPAASFALAIVREPTDSKIVRLLLQALKLPDLGDWVVARPVAI